LACADRPGGISRRACLFVCDSLVYHSLVYHSLGYRASEFVASEFIKRQVQQVINQVKKY
jgi:hypothetical protein